MVLEGNRIVAHYLGGKLTKGYITDFNHNRDSFHIYPSPDMTEGGDLIYQDQLKALFFVKTFEGKPGYEDPIYPEEEIKKLLAQAK